MLKSVLLEELTWTDVEAAVKSGVRTALVMTGSTEQHGPHLPTMTDAAIGQAVGERLAHKLGNAIMAPVVRPGCSDHHLAFPGSLSIPEPVFIDTVVAIVRSLAPHGFDAFVLLSAHGGNFAPLERAAEQLQAEFGPKGVRIISFGGRRGLLDVMRVMNDAAAEHGLRQDADAIHADVTETSVLLNRHAKLVEVERYERGLMGRIDTDELFRRGLKALTPNGILGDPHGATAALGETVIERLAEHFATETRARLGAG